MRALLLRAPWAVWAVHAALLAAGLALFGGLFFLPLTLMMWGVVELTYLVVVHTMSARGGATVGAAVHLGFVGSLLLFLAILGIVLPWFWLPMLALVAPIIYEVAVVISSGTEPVASA